MSSMCHDNLLVLLWFRSTTSFVLWLHGLPIKLHVLPVFITHFLRPCTRWYDHYADYLTPCHHILPISRVSPCFRSFLFFAIGLWCARSLCVHLCVCVCWLYMGSAASCTKSVDVIEEQPNLCLEEREDRQDMSGKWVSEQVSYIFLFSADQHLRELLLKKTSELQKAESW